MDTITELFSSNPLVLVLVAIALMLVMLSFFRTALKLLVVASAAVVLYAGWLQVSGGGDFSETFSQVREVLSNSFEHLLALIRPLFDRLKTLI